MKHEREHGSHRSFRHCGDRHAHRGWGHHHHHPERGRFGGRFGGRGGRHGRVFDYGDLRLLVLAMAAEQPRHGYELMRAIEERMGGSYSPSPGVIYPTLSWLEDMGYARVEAEEGGRKRYAVTAEGQAHLAANRAAADALLARLSAPGEGGRREAIPAPVTRAMENLKMAMRLRLRRGDIGPEAAQAIAGALDAAAQAVERS